MCDRFSQDFCSNLYAREEIMLNYLENKSTINIQRDQFLKKPFSIKTQRVTQGLVFPRTVRAFKNANDGVLQYITVLNTVPYKH